MITRLERKLHQLVALLESHHVVDILNHHGYHYEAGHIETDIARAKAVLKDAHNTSSKPVEN